MTLKISPAIVSKLDLRETIKQVKDQEKGESSSLTSVGVCTGLRAQCKVVVQMELLEPGYLGSHPSPATFHLGDYEQCIQAL